mgnify:CR=1 FL=1
MDHSINPNARLSRIYTPQTLTLGKLIILKNEPAHHLLRVLRHSVGEAVVLFNGDGTEYRGEITETQGNQSCSVRLTEASQPRVESPIRVHLIQAIGRGERMDWAVQKAVELGVTEITPVLTERTQVKLDQKRAQSRQQRWQTIAQAACEQSGRTRMVTLHPPKALTDWQPADHTLSCFLDPRAEESFGQLAPTSALELVVGPEGGLSLSECLALEAKGLTGVSLGPRILRTETAGTVALSAIQTLWGDFR